MYIIVAFCFIFLLIGLATYIGLKGLPWFLPVKLFLFFNGVMGLGILMMLDYENSVDLNHGIIIIISSFCYGLASVFFAAQLSLVRRWRQFSLQPSIIQSKVDFLFSIILYAISGVAVFLYFNLVGYNVILTSLTQGLSASDVKDLRLGSYAGDDYFAPGYFNQFKNILFPISFLALITHLSRRIKSRIIFSLTVIALLVPVILGLMGTGQRAFLVGFFIFAFIFIAIKNQKRSAIKKSVLIYSFVVLLLLFSISSNLLGRSESFSVFDSLEAFATRLFVDNQSSALVGFQYIYDLPIQFGAEWLIDILGILPGEFKGSDLPNRVHAIIYGSDRGTAPVSLWGSVFHNWGWLGIFIFPNVLSFLYCIISKRFLERKNITLIEMAGYAFSFYVLGAWIASGPMQLVNNGLVTCIILIYGLRIHRYLFLR